MAFAIEDALKRLIALQQAGNLAHAYLVCGGSATHQETLANELAAIILEYPKENLSAHPDFHLVRPTSKSRKIVIEQIRHLEQFIQKCPSIGKTKVAILQEADRLAPNAANAFLKSLEEPPGGTYLLLLSSQPDALLPTILSRCVQIPLQTSSSRQVLAHEKAVVDLFTQCLQSNTSSVTQAFQLTRGFQALLAQSKEESESLERFKADTKRYKNATDGKWLQEQEEHFKALTASNLLQTRHQLITAIENYLGSALCAPYRPHNAITTASLDVFAKISEKKILHALDCLTRLQGLLNRGVNEGLALEACFLKMFTFLTAASNARLAQSVVQ